MVLESLVGQINGRPVFASEILEPLDGRLRALTERSTGEARWKAEARKLIQSELDRLIQNELVLSEARSSLQPEMKQGLVQFLDQLQNRLVAQQGGSAATADEASRNTSGRTLSQQTQDVFDFMLIKQELTQHIEARSIVTWRQIQLEYERQYEKYNPKPIAVFRLISVPNAKPEGVDKIKSRLAAGEAFETIADDPANALKGDASTIEVPMNGSPPSLTQTKVFDDPALNKPAESLTVGPPSVSVAGPITYSGSQWWVNLARIDQPPRRPLYDAQLEIEDSLLQKHKARELERYFDRLKARGNVSKIEDMLDRLMVIATDRYFAHRQ